MTDILKQTNLCITALLIVLLPFAADDGFVFPTKTAKSFLFVFAAMLIFSIFLLQIALKKQGGAVKISASDLFTAGFFLYLSAGVLLDINKSGLPSRYVGLLGLAALYLVLRNTDAKRFKLLFPAVLLSGLAQAVYGNLQLYGVYAPRHNLFNITGGFFNPGPYAGYLSLIFPVALSLYLATSGNKTGAGGKGLAAGALDTEITGKQTTKYLSAAALIGILLVLPSTRSRAAWLAVIASSFFILADRYKFVGLIKSKLGTKLKKTLFFALLATITAFSAFGLYGMKKGSSNGRLLIWKVTAQMIAQKPVFGHGYDRFGADYLNYQAAYFGKNTKQGEAAVADNSTRAFNEYLQLTAENGIVGLLWALAIASSVFFGKTRNGGTGSAPVLRGAKMSLLAFGVFAFFSYPAEILPIKLVAVLSLAYIAKSQKSTGIAKNGVFISGKAARAALVTISFAGPLLVLSAFFPLKEKYQSQKKWKRAFTTYQTGLYEASVKEYAEIYETMKYNGAYLVNYGKACSMADEHQKAVGILSRAEKFMPNTIAYTALGDSYKALGKTKKAERAYKKAAVMLPARFYPLYLLAKLYDETGQKQKAAETANIVLNKKIKIRSTAIEEIKTEMRKIIE